MKKEGTYCFFFRLVLLSLLCLPCSTQALAQDHISTSEGLSNRWSTSIVQDNNGLIWVGTINGLNRYDGYRIRQIYTPEITDNNITSLIKDNNGLIWIGTANGLNVLDPSTGTIEKISNPEGLNLLTIKSLTKRNSGEIWISDQYGTMYSVTKEKRLSKRLRLPLTDIEGNLQHTPVEFVAEDKYNVLWIISEWGIIYRYDGKQLTTRKLSPNKLNHPKTLHFAGRDTLLVGSRYTGLFYYAHWPGSLFTDPFIDSVNKVSKYVSCSFAESDDMYWFGFNTPVVMKLDFKSRINRTGEYGIPDGLVNIRAHQIMIDRDQLVWVCTDEGIWKIRPLNRMFTNYFSTADKKYSIRAMMQDQTGKYYISTYAGFVICDSLMKVISPPTLYNRISNFRGAPFVRSMLEDDNLIWCAPEDIGLSYFDKKKSLFFRAHLTAGTGKIALNEYFSVIRISEHLLWIGTKNGLSAYDIRSGLFTPALNNKLSGSAVYHMIHAPGGLILVSTSSGLYIIRQGQIIQHYNAVQLPSNEVNCTAFSSGTVIYAGTTNGLCRIDFATRKVKTYTTSNGLCNNYINAIQQSDDQALWLSTNYGLSRFDIQGEFFSNYYQKNGLCENEFNRFSFGKSRNGHLMFGTINGLVKFDPSRYKGPEGIAPKLFISAYTRHDYDHDSIIRSDYFLPGTSLKLFVKDHFIAFDLGLTGYDDVNANRYYYRIPEHNDTWIPLGSQHNLRLNSLPPGSFTLELKGVNSEGLEAGNIISIPVYVKNVYFRSWWFIALVILGCGMMIYLGYRYRIRQIMKLQQIRTKIASDLHDEVGGLLTRISIQSELIKQQKQVDQGQQEQLDRISVNSKHAVEMMGDVLWSIDARSDTVKNLIDRMNDHISVLEEKNIRHTFTTDVADLTRHLDSDKRQHIYRIFKEAVTNILKHSNATEASFRLIIKHNQLTLSIRDNGTAPANTQGNGQGLRNMKMRSDTIGGSLEINTIHGFEVILKCNI